MLLQLELVADAGFVVIYVLVIIVITNACSHGLPALRDGSFSLYGFNSIGVCTNGHLSATYGVKFATQGRCFNVLQL